MSETLVHDSAKQEIVTAATLVTNLLWQDFEPLSDNFVDGVNKSNLGTEYSLMMSGSERHFSTEDFQSDAYLGISEMYLSETFEGERSDMHTLSLLVEHENFNFLFTLNLDNGEMGIETDKSRHVMDLEPSKYPAIQKRVLGSLALIAGNLL